MYIQVTQLSPKAFHDFMFHNGVLRLKHQLVIMNK